MNPKERIPTEPILPSDVRYALQYREAKLGKSEISDLARNGFPEDAFYFIMKSHSDNPELQMQILSEFYAMVRGDGDQDPDTLKSFLEKQLETFVEGRLVKGAKVAQHSRQGLELWRNLYKKKAIESANRINPTFIAGHSTFFGLAPFVREHDQAEKELHILMPEHFANEDYDSCGYVLRDGSVLYLPKDFIRPEDAIIIDDVKNTGKVEKNIRDFWLQSESAPEPSFEYLDNVGGHHMV